MDRRISRRLGFVKKAAITFLFIVLNGTWVMAAYLLHVTGVRAAVIATVVAFGILLGNLAMYGGVKLAERLLRKSGT
jgi:hypothetical protein